MEGLSQLLIDDSDRYNAFWSQSNADDIASENYWRHEAEIIAIFEDIKEAWEHADAPMAGWAYGQFWNLLMSQP